MKVTERGQLTIPKGMQKRFGLFPGTEVDLVPENGRLYLRKKIAYRRKARGWEKWVGYCRDSFEELGNPSVDEFIEMVRGR